MNFKELVPTEDPDIRNTIFDEVKEWAYRPLMKLKRDFALTDKLYQDIESHAHIVILFCISPLDRGDMKYLPNRTWNPDIKCSFKTYVKRNVFRCCLKYILNEQRYVEIPDKYRNFILGEDGYTEEDLS